MFWSVGFLPVRVNICGIVGRFSPFWEFDSLTCGIWSVVSIMLLMFTSKISLNEFLAVGSLFSKGKSALADIN